jgi:hypothetical protein
MALKSSRQSHLPSTLWLIFAARSLTRSLIELGQASEEVFRGDRLPILNFPEPDEQQ